MDRHNNIDRHRHSHRHGCDQLSRHNEANNITLCIPPVRVNKQERSKVTRYKFYSDYFGPHMHSILHEYTSKILVKSDFHVGRQDRGNIQEVDDILVEATPSLPS